MTKLYNDTKTHHHTERLSRDLTDLTWYCGVVLIAVDVLHTGDVESHNKPAGQIIVRLLWKLLFFVNLRIKNINRTALIFMIDLL